MAERFGLGQFVKGRVAVFIDAANIFYSQRTLGWRISYERLKEFFEEESDVQSLFVYAATDDERPEQAKFVSMLKNKIPPHKAGRGSS